MFNVNLTFKFSVRASQYNLQLFCVSDELSRAFERYREIVVTVGEGLTAHSWPVICILNTIATLLIQASIVTGALRVSVLQLALQFSSVSSGLKIE